MKIGNWKLEIKADEKTTYHELTSILLENNFTRIESDDRLLDVFPRETSEKGIELWEKIKAKKATIIRIHEPQSLKQVTTHQIPTSDLEQALQNNQTLNLTNYPSQTI